MTCPVIDDLSSSINLQLFDVMANEQRGVLLRISTLKANSSTDHIARIYPFHMATFSSADTPLNMKNPIKAWRRSSNNDTIRQRGPEVLFFLVSLFVSWFPRHLSNLMNKQLCTPASTSVTHPGASIKSAFQTRTSSSSNVFADRMSSWYWWKKRAFTNIRDTSCLWKRPTFLLTILSPLRVFPASSFFLSDQPVSCQSIFDWKWASGGCVWRSVQSCSSSSRFPSTALQICTYKLQPHTCRYRYITRSEYADRLAINDSFL